MKFKDIRLKGFSKRIKLDKAVDLCIETFNRFSVEEIDIVQNSVSKRILAEDIYANRSIPPFDRAAMDGYVVKASDTVGASENNPLTLQVIGEIEIGQFPAKKIKQGTAIRIPTGGMVPEGADAVVMVEDTAIISQESNEIEVYASVHPGKNISFAGEDFKKNDLILRAGKRLDAVDRGFLLSAGVSKVKVSCVPKIAILSTGNELVTPWNQKLEPGKIPDVNSINLYEMCLKEGWKATILGIVPDIENSLRQAIEKAAKEYDVVLLSGGSSVGKKDFIPSLLNKLGTLVFHGIAMRPGGPICASLVNDKIAFGLPGFPTATLVAFQFVVKPVLLSLMGLDKSYQHLKLPVKVARNVGSKLGRLDFLRVRLERTSSGELQAIPIQIGGSGILRNMIEGTAIIAIPEASEGLKEGDIVEAIVWGYSPISIDSTSK
ncbi:MAG: molybdopterin molybdotransferase MoeA, partial [Candidatus Hodarchaeales archaeon]